MDLNQAPSHSALGLGPPAQRRALRRVSCGDVRGVCSPRSARLHRPCQTHAQDQSNRRAEGNLDRTSRILSGHALLRPGPAGPRRSCICDRDGPCSHRPTGRVLSQTGEEIRGERLNEDTFALHILDASGVIHAVDKLTREVRSLTVRGVRFDRLVKASQEPHNWLMYWGDYQGTHYSPLTQIDTSERPTASSGVGVPDARRRAARSDAARHRRRDVHVAARRHRCARRAHRTAALAIGAEQKVKNPNEINPFNRGVAVLDQRLFVGTLDAALVALDVSTGLPFWEIAGRRLDARIHASPARRWSSKTR